MVRSIRTNIKIDTKTKWRNLTKWRITIDHFYYFLFEFSEFANTFCDNLDLLLISLLNTLLEFLGNWKKTVWSCQNVISYNHNFCPTGLVNIGSQLKITRITRINDIAIVILAHNSNQIKTCLKTYKHISWKDQLYCNKPKS